jgi:hypothetical protein
MLFRDHAYEKKESLLQASYEPLDEVKLKHLYISYIFLLELSFYYGALCIEACINESKPKP